MIIILLGSALGGLVFYVVFHQKGSGVIIGGCGGVAPESVYECCETLAQENQIFKPACVGYWIIEEWECEWVCS